MTDPRSYKHYAFLRLPHAPRDPGGQKVNFTGMFLGEDTNFERWVFEVDQQDASRVTTMFQQHRDGEKSFIKYDTTYHCYFVEGKKAFHVFPQAGYLYLVHGVVSHYDVWIDRQGKVQPGGFKLDIDSAGQLEEQEITETPSRVDPPSWA